MDFVRDWLLASLRWLPFRRLRRRRFASSLARQPPRPDLPVDTSSRLRVLVLGVYLADRPNSIEHLVERFADEPGLMVEQRWAALSGSPATPAVAAVTVHRSERLEPKFTLVNRLLQNGDLQAFDYIVVCDDDIHCPRRFLTAFLQYQAAYDLAMAQPARTWTSHFDHAFVLRRPWWRVRETRFVECGPMVSFRRDAASALIPFAHPEQLWGLDFVWPLALERKGLRIGIVDAVPVDHSLRPQGVGYSKETHDAAMHRFLAATPHLSMREAFTVLAGRRRPLTSGRPGTS